MSFLSRTSPATPVIPAAVGDIPGELPTAVPLAPKALERKNAAHAELAGLEAQIPRLVLNRDNGNPGAAVALRDHLALAEKAKAEFNLAAIAHDEAIDQDAAAAKRRIEAIRALAPDDAIAGITAMDCCDGCGPSECMIAGGLNRCMHPQKGGVPPAHHNDRVIRSFSQAARDEIAAQQRGDEDDEEDEEENAA